MRASLLIERRDLSERAAAQDIDDEGIRLALVTPRFRSGRRDGCADRFELGDLRRVGGLVAVGDARLDPLQFVGHLGDRGRSGLRPPRVRPPEARRGSERSAVSRLRLAQQDLDATVFRRERPGLILQAMVGEAFDSLEPLFRECPRDSACNRPSGRAPRTDASCRSGRCGRDARPCVPAPRSRLESPRGLSRWRPSCAPRAAAARRSRSANIEKFWRSVRLIRIPSSVACTSSFGPGVDGVSGPRRRFTSASSAAARRGGRLGRGVGRAGCRRLFGPGRRRNGQGRRLRSRRSPRQSSGPHASPGVAAEFPRDAGSRFCGR